MLRVEQGTGIDYPNSYADMACADAYCVPRGLWPATAVIVDTEAGTETPDAESIEKKESALIRAFDWLNTLDWLGHPLDWQQQAAWPREDVPIPGQADRFIDSDTVPRVVIQAQLEAAALIFNGHDMFAPKDRGGKVRSESHSHSEGSLDVIGGDSTSDSYTYAESAPIETYYPAVMGLIGPLLASVPGRTLTTRVMESGRG